MEHVHNLEALTGLEVYLKTLQGDRPYYRITGCDPETGTPLAQGYGWSEKEAAAEFRKRNLMRCRLILLRAQKGRCAVCGRARGLDCDHKRSRAQGGTDELPNLWMLCTGQGGCHPGKHRIY